MVEKNNEKNTEKLRPTTLEEDVFPKAGKQKSTIIIPDLKTPETITEMPIEKMPLSENPFKPKVKTFLSTPEIPPVALVPEAAFPIPISPEKLSDQQKQRDEFKRRLEDRLMRLDAESLGNAVTLSDPKMRMGSTGVGIIVNNSNRDYAKPYVEFGNDDDAARRRQDDINKALKGYVEQFQPNDSAWKIPPVSQPKEEFVNSLKDRLATLGDEDLRTARSMTSPAAALSFIQERSEGKMVQIPSSDETLASTRQNDVDKLTASLSNAFDKSTSMQLWKNTPAPAQPDLAAAASVATGLASLANIPGMSTPLTGMTSLTNPTIPALPDNVPAPEKQEKADLAKAQQQLKDGLKTVGKMVEGAKQKAGEIKDTVVGTAGAVVDAVIPKLPEIDVKDLAMKAVEQGRNAIKAANAKANEKKSVHSAVPPEIATTVVDAATKVATTVQSGGTNPAPAPKKNANVLEALRSGDIPAKPDLDLKNNSQVANRTNGPLMNPNDSTADVSASALQNGVQRAYVISGLENNKNKEITVVNRYVDKATGAAAEGNIVVKFSEAAMEGGRTIALKDSMNKDAKPTKGRVNVALTEEEAKNAKVTFDPNKNMTTVTINNKSISIPNEVVTGELTKDDKLINRKGANDVRTALAAGQNQEAIKNASANVLSGATNITGATPLAVVNIGRKQDTGIGGPMPV